MFIIQNLIEKVIQMNQGEVEFKCSRKLQLRNFEKKYHPCDK